MEDPIAMRNYLALKKKSFAVKFDLENTDYTAVENIGTGAYGVVCSAVNNKTKQKVAIKKISGIFGHSTTCIAKRTYREIKILKHFKHDNIVGIIEILHPGPNLEEFKDVYIVLDLMESDLHRIIYSKQELTEEHVRFFTYQILRGLKYMHSANVVHRDMKPSNLLVNENCDLKIGDFGMARGLSSNMDDYSMVITQYVATRWYRAPELIISSQVLYNEAVDMWSMGCILGEMLGRKQLFPGNNHRDQLEKILDKVGAPSHEYLKQTSTKLITDIILKRGNTKSVSWPDVYPKASKKAVDLLSKMLVLDPRKRITVTQALKHPFLSKYHDPDDEPICIPVFNFDFERKSMTKDELKAAILDEIMSYHKVKQKPRIPFNFRPVPKSELQPTPSIENKDENITDTLKSQTAEELSATLQKSQSSSQNSSVSSKSDGSFERKHSELIQQLKEFEEMQSRAEPKNSDHDIFKKPEGFPLSVTVKDSSKRVQYLKSGNDVEMISAKSTGKREQLDSLDIKTAEVPDVDMISAKSTGQESSKNLSEQTDTSQTLNTETQEGITKAVDTKELIRMALLNNERRKLKEGDNPAKPKPITALQKQREREEKKRQKLEKARQRKKKDKQRKASGLELTDEDKKLLEKWNNMQKTPTSTKPATTKIPCLPSTTTSSVTSGFTKIILQPTAIVTTIPTGQFITVNQTVSQVPTISIPNAIIANSGNFFSQSSKLSTNFPVISKHKEASPDRNVNVIGNGMTENSNLTNFLDESSMASSEAQVSDDSLPFDAFESWSENETPKVDSRLPTYSEAIQAKTMNTNPGVSIPSSSGMYLPFSPKPWTTAQEPIEKNKSQTSTDVDELNLKIIIKQLRQSNVEDLTLTHTPKGTGGGYGVACDWDLLMENEGQHLDHRLESAQVSPTLYNDWQELTGNIDPGEFESVLNEYMMSPISSQELNTVMLSLMSPRINKKSATENQQGSD